MAFQPLCPAFVGVAFIVLATICLNHEPVPDAGEIQDERSDGVLTAEFVTAKLASAQGGPEAALRIR